MEEQFKKLDTEQLWNNHHDSLINRSSKHSTNASEETPNSLLNRYLDVKPYDRSRVKLTRCPDTDYINANIVTVPKAARQYILTQGPLPDTISHFWAMIWEQKSNVIVMLNRLVETGTITEEYERKCEQYWPESVNDSIDYDDINIRVTLKSVKKDKHFMTREMTIEDTETNESRPVIQYHYTAWPDHDVPESPTSFLRLLAAIRKSRGLDKMDEPAVVHCSAGIGRSGTFCLIDSIMCIIENQGTTEGIDIDTTLIEMREYRMGLIQSPGQLRFAYMTIIYGIKILERANKLHPHISLLIDHIAPENNSKKDNANGSQANGRSKKTRRRKKKANATGAKQSLTSIFNKNLLVEALNDVDSDGADRLFEDTMRLRPGMKKARNSSPSCERASPESPTRKLLNGSQSDDTESASAKESSENNNKAQKLTNAIQQLLSDNTISKTNTNSASATAALQENSSTQNVDSALLRRRERDLKNQKLAEKTQDIKEKMKAEDLKRERMQDWIAFSKKSAVYGGVVVLVLSSIMYAYLHSDAH